MAEKEEIQPALFDKGEWWDEHWKGMPEFVQKDLEPVKQLIVNFENWEDYDAFGKLIEQKLTTATRAVWYPEAEIGRIVGKCYVDTPPSDPNDEVLDEQ